MCICGGCTLDMGYVAFMMFFFQAEDGIRDLVRSRGLGDVYKRQPLGQLRMGGDEGLGRGKGFLHGAIAGIAGDACIPVSYTHLTLPTSDLV